MFLLNKCTDPNEGMFWILSWEALNLNCAWVNVGLHNFFFAQELHCMKFGNNREQRSHIWPYFQLNSPYTCSAKRSVVDSNHCMWSNCKHVIVLRVCWNHIPSNRTPLLPVWKLTVFNVLARITVKQMTKAFKHFAQNVKQIEVYNKRMRKLFKRFAQIIIKRLLNVYKQIRKAFKRFTWSIF